MRILYLADAYQPAGAALMSMVSVHTREIRSVDVCHFKVIFENLF